MDQVWSGSGLVWIRCTGDAPVCSRAGPSQPLTTHLLTKGRGEAPVNSQVGGRVSREGSVGAEGVVLGIDQTSTSCCSTKRVEPSPCVTLLTPLLFCCQMIQTSIHPSTTPAARRCSYLGPAGFCQSRWHCWTSPDVEGK